MREIYAAIACNLDHNVLQAALPLFAAEKVEAIEWSFDTLFRVRNIPSWFTELLNAYGKEKRIVGHGVYFSIFSGNWSADQDDWLKRLKRMSKHFNFDHVTEHFGFMTGENFHKGAPISIPFNKTTLSIGHDRLKRIYNACECPVGLENLAFAYSIEEVKRHGEFLEQLVAPVNGFIILDLHNLFCQLHNFDVEYDDIIALYPLELVREIHVSGGSWEDSEIVPDKKIRRDTHDEAVPDEVFELLQKTIPQCPNLKYVVLEQVGTGLKSAESHEQFRNDFDRMTDIIDQHKSTPIEILNDFIPTTPFEVNPNPLIHPTLHQQQIELSRILENATDYNDVKLRLQNSSLAKTDWQIEKWEPHMLETVFQIVQKWKG